MQRVCLIGHSDYSLKMRSAEKSMPFGEVNNARKFRQTLLSHGIPVSEVLDIFELFGIDDLNSERAADYFQMLRINIDLARSGVNIITDFNNDISQTFRRNLSKAIAGTANNILLILSWPEKAVTVLATGVQKHYPTIGKEASYVRSDQLAEPFPLNIFSEEVDLVISESLLGAYNCKSFGVPLDKFLYVPNLAPPEARQLLEVSASERRSARNAYLHTVAKAMNKGISIKENAVVIGCPSRFVRRKNIDMLIYACAELYKEDSNIILLLKGDMDAELDTFSLYSEKLYHLLRSVEKEPWFLWDKTHTSYPDVLMTYTCFDICALISGAELASNTIVEVLTLGIPTLLMEASAMPYLYREMAQFVQGGDLCSALWAYPQPRLDDLIEKLRQMVRNSAFRNELGRRAAVLAERRFGEEQLKRRVPLIADAARSFFDTDSRAESFKKCLLDTLREDLKEYALKEPLDLP